MRDKLIRDICATYFGTADESPFVRHRFQTESCLSVPRCAEIVADPNCAKGEEREHLEAKCRYCEMLIAAVRGAQTDLQSDLIAMPNDSWAEKLEASYEYCKHVAKTQAKNFYYSFTVLPPEKKASMCAVYAFMRYSDDISDEAALSSSKHDLLPRWHAALDRAFEGDYGDSKILPAFHDTVKQYAIPKRFFHELIDGAEMDLTRTRYENFEELYEYCYRVASTVGFICFHVWGFDGGASTYLPVEACGIAFQLTNILRDVKEDAERGRIYLPREDLQRFGLSEQDILENRFDERFHALMQFETERARDYYRQAVPLIPLIDPVSRPTFVIMFRIYRGLLERIVQQGYNVFASRASLSTAKKVSIVARAWLGSRLPGGERLLAEPVPPERVHKEPVPEARVLMERVPRSGAAEGNEKTPEALTLGDSWLRIAMGLG